MLKRSHVGTEEPPDGRQAPQVWKMRLVIVWSPNLSAIDMDVLLGHLTKVGLSALKELNIIS